VYLDCKYSYRRTLPHFVKDNHPVFVTFGTFRRWELPAAARQLAFDCCLQEHGVTIDLHAVVVMPTHAHLLFNPRRDAEGWLFSPPKIMRLIKGRSAHSVNLLLERHGPVWQEDRLTMYCAPMRVCARRWITFARIQCELDWCAADRTTAGCGEVSCRRSGCVVTGLRPVLRGIAPPPHETCGAKPRHHTTRASHNLNPSNLSRRTAPPSLNLLSWCNSASSPQTPAHRIFSGCDCRGAQAGRDRAGSGSGGRSPVST